MLGPIPKNDPHQTYSPPEINFGKAPSKHAVDRKTLDPSKSSRISKQRKRFHKTTPLNLTRFQTISCQTQPKKCNQFPKNLQEK